MPGHTVEHGYGLTPQCLAEAEKGAADACQQARAVARALRTAAVFGDRLPPLSSTKSMTGHMLGAAGAAEAIFAIQALRTGTLPPTINQETPDPQCDVDCVPNVARKVAIGVAMSAAFGFGGHNSVLVLRRASD